MSNKIIVTGAGGQLGQEIQAAADTCPEFEFIFLSRSELPINDAQRADHYFKTYKPAFCINCAAYTAVDRAETEQEAAFSINGYAVGILADACVQYGSRLIHISTDYVFNGIASSPYKEDDVVDPVNLYGASKLKGEQLAMQNPSTSLVIRTSWVYSEYGNNFVKTMMRLMRDRENIKVVNDQLGSPTYAADLAMVILSIIKTATWNPGIYHYSNDGIITWYDFALSIKELTYSKCNVHPIPSSEYPTPAKRPGYSVLGKKKIIDTYDIVLSDWKESLSRCITKMK